MNKELYQIMQEEARVIENLISELDNQYKCIIKDDVFSMEDAVEKLQNISKEIAAWEMKRREMTGNRSMRDIVNESGSEELDTLYRKIKKLLEEAKLQEETNELLLKQGLSFTNQMLNILKPNRETKTYNSYGKMKR